MNELSLLGVILGSSWTSGINLYLTAAGLGIADRMGWIELPGQMDILSNPIIIALAVIIYLIEFLADKIPLVDSAWDAAHTFVRPVGGALLAYLATSEWAPTAQAAMALVGGSVAFDSHLTKASSRVAINASPEPISNIAASVTEDAVVISSLWLMIQHPVILLCLVLLFIAFSIWLIPKLFGLFKKVFGFLFKKRADSSPNNS